MRKKKLVLLMLSSMLLTACQKNEVKQEPVIIEEEVEQPDVIEENMINETETIIQEEIIIKEENIVEQEIEVDQRDEEIETSTADKTTKEEQVKNYIEEAKAKVDELVESENVTNMKKFLKEEFIILVEFLFNHGEIKGISFHELSDQTKQEVKDGYTYILDKIITVYPEFEEIKEQTTTVLKDGTKYTKEKGTEIIGKLNGKIEEKMGTENYQQTQETIGDVKEKTKEGIDKGKQKIIEKYQQFKNNN